MTNVLSQAADYLAAEATTYWKWSDDWQAIEWADGRTIVFLPELTAVLERLAPEGLPPLGSVLLLLAACRNNWREPPSRRGLLAGALDAECGPDARSLVWEACAGLDKAHALPADLRQSVEARAELAAMVFVGAPHQLDREISQAIVAALRDENIAGAANVTAPAAPTPWMLRDLAALRAGLNEFDEATLRLRLKTGAPSLPRPAPVEPPRPTGLAWLAWLERQEEFAGLARLARRLVAAIQIPRRLHDPDELPIGGVSDISPRGSLDRLLLSELAHDDLTLALRVAMNEALYLRREAPPKTPPRQRHVLLDSGLRSWGLPRLYGAAVGLALSARADGGAAVVAHRAKGAELVPVELHTPEGLREHLAALDHRLHPGESLPALADLLAQDGAGEAVLVTSDATLADPEFRRALDERLPGGAYLAVVSRDGRFELRRHSRGGYKTLGVAQFSLEEILGSRKAASAARDKTRERLPAIFHAERFPLLLGLQTGPNPQNSWHIDGWGLLTHTHDGRLMRSRVAEQGAQELFAGLPDGQIQSLACSGAEKFPLVVVVGKLSRYLLRALWIDEDGIVERQVTLSPSLEHIKSIAADRDYVYLISDTEIEAVNVRTGQALPRRLAVGQRDTDLHGLYMRGRKASAAASAIGWLRLTANETGIELTQVHAPNNAANAITNVVRAFDCEDVEGPVLVTQEGSIVFTGSGKELRIVAAVPPIEVSEVARNGRRFLAKHAGGSLVVTIHTGATLAARQPRFEFELEPEIRPFAASHHPQRRRFAAIGATPGRGLALMTAKQTAITLVTQTLNFVELESHGDMDWKNFEPFEHEQVTGFSLQRVVFAEGSQAVLDSRGLLHLVSSDPALPQATIVLRDGHSAGWLSDGRVWGSPYYIGDRTATGASAISREAIKPIVERWR